MGRLLNIALVGGGRIADMHAPGYLKSERARLYGLCDVSPQVCERRAREWSLAKTFTDYEALLDDKAVDAVEILTPHPLHHKMVIMAAEAGKHVSVQKPMAMSLAECDEMIAACARAGVHFKVFENFVFYPAYPRAREVFESGAIGDPLCIRTRLAGGHGGWEVPLRSWTWRLKETEHGGGPTIFDDGYHKFSVAMDFFGLVESVTGWIERTGGLIDAPAALSWKHENGVLGYMDAALTPNLYMEGKYYAVDERVEITGTKGRIDITACTSRPLEAPPLIVETDGRVEAHTDLEVDWLASFVASTEDFVDAILSDRTPHLTGERGRDVTAFAMSAIEAAARGEVLRPSRFGESA